MKKGSLLAGLGLIGACSLCCALPVVGSVAALGISSFFMNPIVIAGLALILVVAGVVLYQRRQSKGTSCMTTGCGCHSCATKEA